jgi:putative flavoprotein involved in K+ transport
MTTLNPNPDVLVIGAGQAGLAVGYHLRQTPLSFQIVERHARIGDTWRGRYDSLALFTPRAYSSLPGYTLPGDPNGYAGRDEFASYLEAYAQRYRLPVAASTRISRLERAGARFRAAIGAHCVITATAVVLATGAFQRPAVPAITRQFSPEVVQLTSETYRNVRQIPAGPVLVVGDGATGRDIAAELAASHSVILATGRQRKATPERVLGKSLFWWLDGFGLLTAPSESAVGRWMRASDPFPARGNQLRQLRQRGIRVVGRLQGGRGRRAAFAGGAMAEVQAVIWATGYRDDSEWVAIPEVVDSAGSFVQQQGISPVPSLYFIGRPWQRSRASALIGGVGRDAALLVARIMHDLTPAASESQHGAAQ